MIWAKGKNTVAGLFYRCGGMVQGLVRSAIGDPDLRSPSGFDSGLRPPLRMTREARCRVGALGDRRSRPAVALRVRLRASPSAQDDTRGGMVAQSLDLRWVYGASGCAPTRRGGISEVGQLFHRIFRADRLSMLVYVGGQRFRRAGGAVFRQEGIFVKHGKSGGVKP